MTTAQSHGTASLGGIIYSMLFTGVMWRRVKAESLETLAPVSFRSTACLSAT